MLYFHEMHKLEMAIFDQYFSHDWWGVTVSLNQNLPIDNSTDISTANEVENASTPDTPNELIHFLS